VCETDRNWSRLTYPGEIHEIIVKRPEPIASVRCIGRAIDETDGETGGGLRVVCGTLWVQVAQQCEPYRLRSIIRDRRDGNPWAQMSKDDVMGRVRAPARPGPMTWLAASLGHYHLNLMVALIVNQRNRRVVNRLPVQRHPKTLCT
jgi:hypothetical protein